MHTLVNAAAGCRERHSLSTAVAVLAVLAALGHSATAAAQTPLFSDDFSRTTGLGSNWRIQYGGFTTDGSFAISGPTTPSDAGDWAALVPSLPGNDYEVTATLTIPAGSLYSGIVARGSPTNFRSDLYNAQLSTDGTVNLYRRNGDSVWTKLASQANGIVAGTPYTLSLTTRGSNPVHLEVRLNGVLLFSHDDASAGRIVAGVPGIETFDGNVRFDSFAVYSTPPVSPGNLLPSNVVAGPTWVGQDPDVGPPNPTIMTLGAATGSKVGLTEVGSGGHWVMAWNQGWSSPTVTLSQPYELRARVYPGSRTTLWIQLQTYGAAYPMCNVDLAAGTSAASNGATTTIASAGGGAYDVTCRGSFTSTSYPPHDGSSWVAVIGTPSGAPAPGVAVFVENVRLLFMGNTTPSCANTCGGTCPPCSLTAAVSTAGGNPPPTSAAVDFGTVLVGQTRAVPVLVTNTGSVSRTIASRSVTAGPDVSVGHFTPGTLAPCASSPCAPAATTWVTVSWTPSAAGTLSGAATLLDAAGAPLVTVPVGGTAVALTGYADVTNAQFAGGAHCDSGATDSTAAFRAAAATGQLVYVPASPCTGGRHYALSGPVTIGGPGVVGEPGAARPTIRMYGANGGTGANPSAHLMFEVASNAGPVIFTGLHLDGGWDGATMPVGEWDHLIELRGASNVTIESNLLENPYGDCVFLGGGYLPPAQNIVIRNNTCRNPWRCTVGFVSVNGALVVGNTLDKPNGGPRPADPTGAEPAGSVWYHFNIDFEPDPYPDVTPAESDWNVELAFNEISSHVPRSRYPWDVGLAVVLSHSSGGLPPDGWAGGNLSIHDNSGSAGQAFLQPSGHGNGYAFWQNVSVYRNFNPNGCFPPLRNCQ